MKLQFKRIYRQEAINTKPEWCANADAILARFPDAEVIPVTSHWGIDDLFEADPADWMRSKRENLVLGIKSGLQHVKNGRSANYIAASNSNGCLSSCQYCYVARRKGGSNPLTIFINIEQIANSIRRHSTKLGPKPGPDQCDENFWTYDIGCNSDLSLDALICDNPGYLVRAFADMPYAKATLATKTVNDAYWMRQDPQGKTRIRYSVMPQRIARYVDIGTSPVSERIQSVNKLVDAGYEVHFNFSPIILYEGDQWRRDWVELWQEIDDTLSERAKRQLMCEAFFLTHSADLHATNLQWNPKGEEFLWSPETQVPKKTAPDLVVYDYTMRQAELTRFTAGLKHYLPYCPVRYSF
ncbi:MAG: spore photoproduct lyase family protein [Chloroflexota bacterium]|nr:spore photoproduct lyase family protein [Chloroflexota bacterium]